MPIIRSRYRSDKTGRIVNHPKKSETPVDFVGVDGEGSEESGEHRYVLFGVGEDQIENADGLGWRDVFPFLYGHYRPRTAFVGFFLGYDFSQILRTLPEERAKLLLTSEGRTLRKHRIPHKPPHPVEYQGWQFDLLGNKRFKLRPKGCDCELATCGCKHEPWLYLCDAGPFFQTSFLNVVNPEKWPEGESIVSDEEWAILEAGKSRRSVATLGEEMRLYNRLENIVLARVMRTLDAGFHGIGIHLTASKWFGPGQASQEWLKGQKVHSGKEVEEKVPTYFLEAARASYFGGWFEIMMHGIIPGESHEYDINSAYPYIISSLPCLLHGHYSRGIGAPSQSTSEAGLFMVYGRVYGLSNENNAGPIGSMLHRDKHGRILRPMATEGWFWWDEIQSAIRAGCVGRTEIEAHVRYEPCDCPRPMAAIEGLYRKRIEVGKDSALGKGAKLVYNSGYGKFAQSVGDPIFGNPVYASRITAGCRIQILNAIATHPNGVADVAMVATDAVYFLSPHPGLSISDKLGEWSHGIRTNLCLFKPGVYWDDAGRRQLTEGVNPRFKARGINIRDFAHCIGGIDQQFQAWNQVHDSRRVWPSVEFTTDFHMTTTLQAIRQNEWSRAGVVTHGVTLKQDSNPSEKRQGLWREEYDGRIIYRSRPYEGLEEGPEGMVPCRSYSYEKRFGMEDPFSDESKEMYGVTPDGNVLDLIGWMLHE